MRPGRVVAGWIVVVALAVGSVTGQSSPAAPSSAWAPSVTLVSSTELEETLAATPQGRVTDRQIRMIDAGGINLGVGVVHRPVTTTLSAIQHHDQAEIYRVVEGRGVLVTSPEMTDRQELDPDGATVRTLTGPSALGTIVGGERHTVGPGDIVFIPAGLAHGFSEITEAITYIVYRIDPEQRVELKEGR